MSGLLVVSLIIGGVIGLWLLISPRSAYWTMTAWQYKNPEANEPSDTAYSLSRLSGGIMLVTIVVIVLWVTGATAQAKSDQQTHLDCQSQLLPELTKMTASGSVSKSAMQNFATEHGLTMKESTAYVLGYDPHSTPSVVNVPMYNYTFTKGGRTIISWVGGPGIPSTPPICSV